MGDLEPAPMMGLTEALIPHWVNPMLLGLFSVGVFVLSLLGSAHADVLKVTISKVGEEGRAITVKDKSGKEVEVKISAAVRRSMASRAALT